MYKFSHGAFVSRQLRLWRQQLWHIDERRYLNRKDIEKSTPKTLEEKKAPIACNMSGIDDGARHTRVIWAESAVLRSIQSIHQIFYLTSTCATAGRHLQTIP